MIQTFLLKFRAIGFCNIQLLCLMIFLINDVAVGQDSTASSNPGIKKIKDVIIYKDTLFHLAFPSVIRKKEGTIVVAFRRALERRLIGEKHTNHLDPNSYLA